MELLQTQKADVEQLARRWQDDNKALQARLDAASQRLERLTVERDEAVRRAVPSMAILTIGAAAHPLSTPSPAPLPLTPPQPRCAQLAGLALGCVHLDVALAHLG